MYETQDDYLLLAEKPASGNVIGKGPVVCISSSMLLSLSLAFPPSSVDVVEGDLKSVLRALYLLFSKYKTVKTTEGHREIRGKTTTI